MAVTDDQRFIANPPVIDRSVAHGYRRRRQIAAEAEEFGAQVRLHFIDRNYEPLRRYEGLRLSGLRTYLI